MVNYSEEKIISEIFVFASFPSTSHISLIFILLITQSYVLLYTCCSLTCEFMILKFEPQFFSMSVLFCRLSAVM